MSASARFSFVAAAALSCASLVGCSSPVGLHEIDDEYWFSRETRTALLNPDRPSERTVQFLRRESLAAEFDADPLAVLERLHDRLIASKDRILAFHLAELCYLEASARAEASPEAMQLFASSVVYAYAFLFDSAFVFEIDPFDPNFRWACDFYNRSLGKILAWGRTRKRGSAVRVRIPLVRGSIEISRGLNELRWDVALFEEMLIAFNHEVRGLPGLTRAYGLGVPLILVRPTLDEGMSFRPPLLRHITSGDVQEIHVRQSYAGTALLRFPTSLFDERPEERPRQAWFELYSANDRDAVEIGGRLVPLEIDLSSPLAWSLAQTQDYDGLDALLHSQQYIGAVSLQMLQPYDPKKIPVVFVHGLMSSPNTWMFLLNDLMTDPELRHRYQFWFFRYPTGNPVLISAALLRDSMLELRRTLDPEGKNEAFDQMVLCGHSMGGLLVKLQLVDGGDRLWSALSNKPLAEFEGTEDEVALVRGVVEFQRLPFVQRVVFMAVPHRGSDLATGIVQQIASELISVPSRIVDLGTRIADELAHRVQQGLGMDESEHAITGVGDLAPTSFVSKVVSTWPLPPDLPYHSIIGNEDAADVPGGSDGIVPYESSHLDGAQSEKIVHAKHNVQEHPETVAELRRILRLHLAQLDKSEKAASDRPPPLK